MDFFRETIFRPLGVAAHALQPVNILFPVVHIGNYENTIKPCNFKKYFVAFVNSV